MYHITFNPQSNRASWIGFGQLVDVDDNPIDITGCSMVLEVADSQDAPRLQASTANGKITYPDVGVFRWAFTRDEMRGLGPGTYKTGLTITNDDGTQTTQLSVGPLPIVDGVVP